MTTTDPLAVWIVQNGEELPTDPHSPRLLRQMLLAQELASRGHHVTYWAPTFNHQRKFQRPANDPLWHKGVRIRLLRARSYKSNVSAARIMSHRDAAREFRRAALRMHAPDAVVAGYPTIELAHAAVSFAVASGVPSLIDLRDQWPEIFARHLPGSARPAITPLLVHWRRLRNETIRAADAVCGISSPFVDWGLDAAGRQRTRWDREFPLAPPRLDSDMGQLEGARQVWDAILGKSRDEVVGVYAGNLSGRTDILTVIEAAQRVPSDAAARIRLVVCGSGDLQARVAELSASTSSVIYAGHRNAVEIRALLERADFGMVPYLDSSDFLMSYPNKVGELLSFGLPILTCLGGITGELLRSGNVERRYQARDVESCARTLTTLVVDPPDQHAADRARRIFHEHFDPDVVYPAYADHVEALAHHGRRSDG